MRALRILLERIDPRLCGLVCLLLVAVVGALDYLTGWAVGFSLFYLIPISLATWRIGERHALFVAVASTVAWYTADRLSAPALMHPLIPVWNATMRFGFFIVVTRILGALHAALRREEALARTDHLTGVANSRAFAAAAEIEIERATRYGHPLTIAYIDLDDFKAVNSRLGHLAADELLQKWAATLREELRRTDLLARLGGDEFAMILTETGYGAAEEVLARVRERLTEATAGMGLRVTSSVGAVTFERPPGSLDEMLRAADTLMYEVKRSGKNSVRLQVWTEDRREVG